MSTIVVAMSKWFIINNVFNKARGMHKRKLMQEGTLVELLANCNCNKIKFDLTKKIISKSVCQ